MSSDLQNKQARLRARQFKASPVGASDFSHATKNAITEIFITPPLKLLIFQLTFNAKKKD